MSKANYMAQSTINAAIETYREEMEKKKLSPSHSDELEMEQKITAILSTEQGLKMMLENVRKVIDSTLNRRVEEHMKEKESSQYLKALHAIKESDFKTLESLLPSLNKDSLLEIGKLAIDYEMRHVLIILLEHLKGKLTLTLLLYALKRGEDGMEDLILDKSLEFLKKEELQVYIKELIKRHSYTERRLDSFYSKLGIEKMRKLEILEVFINSKLEKYIKLYKALKEGAS